MADAQQPVLARAGCWSGPRPSGECGLQHHLAKGARGRSDGGVGCDYAEQPVQCYLARGPAVIADWPSRRIFAYGPKSRPRTPPTTPGQHPLLLQVGVRHRGLRVADPGSADETSGTRSHAPPSSSRRADGRQALAVDLVAPHVPLDIVNLLAAKWVRHVAEYGTECVHAHCGQDCEEVAGAATVRAGRVLALVWGGGLGGVEVARHVQLSEEGEVAVEKPAGIRL
jgi:hypothetical protein